MFHIYAKNLPLQLQIYNHSVFVYSLKEQQIFAEFCLYLD